MINFNEEIEKFKPILELDDIEESINDEGFEDILDMLSHILRQNSIK